MTALLFLPSVTEIVFPSTVKTICADANHRGVFAGCSALKVVDMSKMTVNSLICKNGTSNQTFFKATNGSVDLTTIYMPSGITAVDNPFTGCGVDNIYFAAGITSINNISDEFIKNIYLNTDTLDGITFGISSIGEGCTIHVLSAYSGNNTISIATCDSGAPAQFQTPPTVVTVANDYNPTK